jgi:hypothetical protein
MRNSSERESGMIEPGALGEPEVILPRNKDLYEAATPEMRAFVEEVCKIRKEYDEKYDFDNMRSEGYYQIRVDLLEELWQELETVGGIENRRTILEREEANSFDIQRAKVINTLETALFEDCNMDEAYKEVLHDFVEDTMNCCYEKTMKTAEVYGLEPQDLLESPKLFDSAVHAVRKTAPDYEFLFSEQEHGIHDIPFIMSVAVLFNNCFSKLLPLIFKRHAIRSRYIG